VSDTLTGTATEAISDAPEYPTGRAAGCPFAPPPEVTALSEARPLSRVRIWDGSTPWLITGYEVRALFSDSRVSVDDRRPGFPHWNEGMLSTVHKRPRSVFTADAEEHTRFRRMLSRPFTFKRVESLRSVIQQVTDEHIDAMLAGPRPGDIVTALALPVPSLVISQLLGVPYEDAEMFQHHANIGLARYATGEDTVKGAMSLHKYLAQLVEVKMENPAEDAVSDLAERVKAGELSVKEAAQLGTGLLIAGHETTANMIGPWACWHCCNTPSRRQCYGRPTIRTSSRTPSRNCCAICPSSKTASAASPPRTSKSRAKSSVPVKASSSTWHRRTGTPRNSPNPTGCICIARVPASMWRSATAGTNASVSSLPAPSCRSSFTRCSAAFPRWSSPCRSKPFL